jgi:hypothetical protein
VLEFLNNLWGLEPSRKRVAYWSARLHSLAELVPWNRFSGSLKVKKYGPRIANGKKDRRKMDRRIECTVLYSKWSAGLKENG